MSLIKLESNVHVKFYCPQTGKTKISRCDNIVYITEEHIHTQLLHIFLFLLHMYSYFILFVYFIETHNK